MPLGVSLFFYFPLNTLFEMHFYHGCNLQIILDKNIQLPWMFDLGWQPMSHACRKQRRYISDLLSVMESREAAKKYYCCTTKSGKVAQSVVTSRDNFTLPLGLSEYWWVGRSKERIIIWGQYLSVVEMTKLWKPKLSKISSGSGPGWVWDFL